MEGLTASELSMIKKLAGNDGLMRKKTMKKLKTWLTAIAARAPDTADCRVLLESNFVRVWKALFYCMWMADKPMPQEQLADQISSLVEIFESKPNVLNLFVEWFFRTMAREWPYIDRFRMDKFCMLIRRFLRKVLTVMEKNKWKLELLDGFLRTLSVNIFNRRPELKATRASVRVPGIEVSPVGLQTHILDIFMEELAKVGGNTLKNKKLLKILTPFIYELCNNDDDRIINELQERIFRHLMRQSDAGIDYAEGISSEEGVYDDENEENATDEDEEDDEEDRLLDEELENMGPLDPRAGGIDVILPQLKVDYSELAEKLVQAGGQKSTRPKNRKIAYSLAKQFKDISAGQYPLAIKQNEDKSPAIKNTDIDKAARRLLNFEEALTGPEKKIRKSKKARKKLAKKMAANDLDTSETNGSESDNANSFYLEDNELLDHVGDNYMSYLEELHQKETAKTNGVQNGHDDHDTDEDAEQQEEEEEMPKKSKRRRLSQLTNGTPDHVTENKDNLTPLRKTLKQRKSLNIELSTNEESPAAPKKKIMKKRISLPAVVTNTVSENPDEESITNDDEAVVANGNGEVHILLREKPKKRKQSPKAAIKAEAAHTPSTPSNTKKRVSFVLARNLHHEHSDYQQSINRSPAIPYDSGKQPTTGLLKSPKSPAPGASYFSNGLQSTPRRKSGRF